MLRKIKQKGESAILHWRLREGFSDKGIQDQGPERSKGVWERNSILV